MMKLFSKNKSSKEASAASTSKDSGGYYTIKEKSLTKIFKAAWSGDLPKLNSFQSDVNIPDSEKRTALHLACANGQEKAIDILISMGADVNALDKEGKLPLYRAVQANHVLCVKLLLKKAPALVNTELSKTLLHVAVKNSSPEMLGALLASGHKVDATDEGGKTALMLACEMGKPSLVSQLMEKGANPVASDAQGRTCADYAKPHPDCLKILEPRGSSNTARQTGRQLTPRNRTSDDYEDDESKSTDYDIPVQLAAKKRNQRASAAEMDSYDNEEPLDEDARVNAKGATPIHPPP